jgi:peptidoglycan/LPS O-acetylase OafA/YrhL
MQQQDRLHALDAVRAFALLLGVFFHATMSFITSYASNLHWAIADNSQSMVLLSFVGITHVFRMSLFFFIAGFFGHLVYHRKGAAAFARDRTKRIALPFVVGWAIMLPLLGSIWVWGNQKAGLSPLPNDSIDWSTGKAPLSHLWFLYYLLLFYVMIVGARHTFIERIDPQGHLRAKIDRAMSLMLGRHWAAVVFSLPLAFAAIFAPQWNGGTGMPTPDKSFVPELIPMVGYGAAFTVGWLFHRDMALLQLLTTRIKSSLWLALASMILVSATASVLGLVPTLLPGLFRFLAALTATMMMWYFNLALVGFALNKFGNPSPRTRYVADASYWIYIAHLPVICALQVWVAYWPLHWTIKYTFIMGVALAFLFATYHYFVRYTVIGEVLNGKRFSKLEPSQFSRHSTNASQS